MSIFANFSVGPKRLEFKGIVADSISAKYGITVPRERSISKMTEFESGVRQDPLLFRAVNLISSHVIGDGIVVESKGSEQEDQNNPALKAINELNKEVDIEQLIERMVQTAIIYGDSFEEKKTINGGVLQITPINPKTMTILYDKFGTVQGYEQKVMGEEPIKFSPEEILHFRIFELADSKYGMSLFEPVYKLIVTKVTADTAIGNFIKRKGIPFLVAKVGMTSENQPASEKDIATVKAALENIDSKTEFIVPDTVDMSFLESSEGGKTITDLMDYISKQILAGAGIPEILLGWSKGGNPLSSRAEIKGYEKWIKSIQRKVDHLLEIGLYESYLKQNGIDYKEVPSIKWPELNIEDFNMKCTRLINEFNANLITQNQYLQETGRDPVPDGDKYLHELMPQPVLAGPGGKPAKGSTSKTQPLNPMGRNES